MKKVHESKDLIPYITVILDDNDYKHLGTRDVMVYESDGVKDFKLTDTMNRAIFIIPKR